MAAASVLLFRQDDAERRALPGGAVDLDDAVGQLDDALDERQAEAVSHGLAGAVALIEFLKNARLHSGRHAAAVVHDGDDGAFRLVEQAQGQLLPRLTEFDGIADEVRPDLQQQRLAGRHAHGVQLGTKAQRLFLPLRLEHHNGLPQLLIEADESVTLGSFITVADATKCKVYLKNFGEFYTNQIETASAIILSRTGSISEEKLAAAVALLREHNQNAVIITTPWDQLSGAQILEAMQKQHTLTEELADMIRSAQSEEDDEDEEEEHHHHHHHDDDGEEDEHEHPCCHHHDHDDEDEHHCHHHHDHDEDDDEHEHHCCHHHDHDDHDEDEDEHHCCHHHHHHGHDADEVFQSWGVETPKKFTEEEIRNALAALDNGETYGIVLRAKGIVPTADGTWLHFDHVPGEIDVRTGTAAVTGRLCVIGSKLDEKALAALFGV